jgi:hypothetical protein
VRTLLERTAAGSLDLEPLSVSYDSLHPLWGGLLLTIHGSGQVEQKAVRQSAGQPVLVAREDVVDLVRLLLRHEAWMQLVAERPQVPDESRALLTIRYGAEQSTIWEWYHDLGVNRRIIQIRDRMQQIAWRTSKSQCDEDDIADSKY